MIENPEIGHEFNFFLSIAEQLTFFIVPPAKCYQLAFKGFVFEK